MPRVNTKKIYQIQKIGPDFYRGVPHGKKSDLFSHHEALHGKNRSDFFCVRFARLIFAVHIASLKRLMPCICIVSEKKYLKKVPKCLQLSIIIYTFVTELKQILSLDR